MSENQVLYLLSSTAEPYIKDILDILAIPSGFHYRFKYEFKWLPSLSEFMMSSSRQSFASVLSTYYKRSFFKLLL